MNRDEKRRSDQIKLNRVYQNYIDNVRLMKTVTPQGAGFLYRAYLDSEQSFALMKQTIAKASKP